MLGFDALNRGDLSPREAMRRAVEEKRIWIRENLATVGSEYGVRYFVLQSQNLRDQLAEIEAQYHLSEFQQPFSRCLKCNEPISAVDPGEVRDRVPEKIRISIAEFYICRACGRVYWHGSHLKKMKGKLQQMGWKFP
jgi:hypothetical protein